MTTTGKPLARSLAELVLMLAVAVGLAVGIQAFLIKPYEIPSASMLPTLRVQQRILVDRISDRFAAPRLGQIWVFHPPASESCADPAEGQLDASSRSAACDVVGHRRSAETFVKRVVGLPGDRLSIVDGRVVRDGRAERAPYALPCTADDGDCTFSETITVPRGDYYMMGDNRPNSLDSRFWGPVPRRWMIGQAFATYWPPSRIGSL